jgi:hypothetical protein
MHDALYFANHDQCNLNQIVARKSRGWVAVGQVNGGAEFADRSVEQREVLATEKALAIHGIYYHPCKSAINFSPLGCNTAEVHGP